MSYHITLYHITIYDSISYHIILCVGRVRPCLGDHLRVILVVATEAKRVRDLRERSVYIHAYMHTYMHAYIHTYIHTYIHV